MSEPKLFVVERVLDDRLNPIAQAREWQVKWESQEGEEISWEPFDGLKDNEKFIEYIALKNQRLFKVTTQ